MPKIIVLSGGIASGKTTLAHALVARYDLGTPISTSAHIRQTKGVTGARLDMQAAGDALDLETDGAWVADLVSDRVRSQTIDAPIVMDAIRRLCQIGNLRKRFEASLLHVHLTAPLEVRAKRYEKREGGHHLGDAQWHPTETVQQSLEGLADLVIDTTRTSTQDAMIQVVAHAGITHHIWDKGVDVLVGGQYGSEGKGHIASFLADEYDFLMRVGGPNAGHTVMLENDMASFTFHHLPSGTIHNPHAMVLIGAGAVLRVPKLISEIQAADIMLNSSTLLKKRLMIHPQAMVIEDEDIEAESAGLRTGIGSTASGTGWASARKILDRHHYGCSALEQGPPRLARDIESLKPYIGDVDDILAKVITGQKGKLFLEGTQGTSLSLHHGHYPHVTSRDTTVQGCLAEAGIPARCVDRVIMVCRSYPIRVGNAPETDNTSGYMKQELSWAEIAKRSGIPVETLVRKELTSTTKRLRRIAEFDWEQLERSVHLNAPTDIAFTFADYVDVRNREATRFNELTLPTLQMLSSIEKVTNCPVNWVSKAFATDGILTA